jgi:subtilisin family serine protease
MQINNNNNRINNPIETWGLKRTKVIVEGRNDYVPSGRGIRVAILDTGLDLTHRDFAGRIKPENCKSFLTDIGIPTAQDDNGHGTHCAGIACGSLNPATGRRYGIAHKAELFIGKVADYTGFPFAPALQAGIRWAIDNNCHIISMSLGFPDANGDNDFNHYQELADEAMQRGILLIAAAGNASHRNSRPPDLQPIFYPANLRNVIAVGSIDSDLSMSSDSNRGTKRTGAGVTGIDIVAPGGNIYSSWLGGGTHFASGTSQATAYVAGIAALYAESVFGAEYKAGKLRERLFIRADKTLLSSYSHDDIGAGLVIAPI